MTDTNKTTLSPTMTHACEDCNLRFDTQGQLTTHYDARHCDEAQISFANGMKWVVRRGTNGPNADKLPCPNPSCREAFLWIDYLTLHLRNSSCRLWALSSTPPTSSSSTRVATTGSSINGQQNYTCHLCRRIFPSYSHLTRHNKDWHIPALHIKLMDGSTQVVQRKIKGENVGKFLCPNPDCSKLIATATFVKHHLKTSDCRWWTPASQTSSKEANKRPHPPAAMTVDDDHLDSLGNSTNVHNTNNTSDDSTTCLVCDIAFQSTKALKIHQSEFHRTGLRICLDNGMTIIMHRTAVNNTRFLCANPGCDKTFARCSGIRTHMKNCRRQWAPSCGESSITPMPPLKVVCVDKANGDGVTRKLRDRHTRRIFREVTMEDDDGEADDSENTTGGALANSIDNDRAFNKEPILNFASNNQTPTIAPETEASRQHDSEEVISDGTAVNAISTDSLDGGDIIMRDGDGDEDETEGVVFSGREEAVDSFMGPRRKGGRRPIADDQNRSLVAIKNEEAFQDNMYDQRYSRGRGCTISHVRTYNRLTEDGEDEEETEEMCFTHKLKRSIENGQQDASEEAIAEEQRPVAPERALWMAHDYLQRGIRIRVKAHIHEVIRFTLTSKRASLTLCVQPPIRLPSSFPSRGCVVALDTAVVEQFLGLSHADMAKAPVQDLRQMIEDMATYIISLGKVELTLFGLRNTVPIVQLLEKIGP